MRKMGLLRGIVVAILAIAVTSIGYLIQPGTAAVHPGVMPPAGPDAKMYVGTLIPVVVTEG
jgi:hypothetical protein